MRSLNFIVFFILKCLSGKSQISNHSNSIGIVYSPLLYSKDEKPNLKYPITGNYLTGVLYRRTFYWNKQLLSLRLGFVYQTKQYSVHYKDTISWYPKDMHTSFTYYTWPILLDYNFRLKKVNIYLSSGIIIGRVAKQQQKSINNDNTVGNGFNSRVDNEKRPFCIQHSVGIEYIEKWFSVFAEPVFRYQTNGNNPVNMDKYGKKSFGIIMGINYNFGKLKDDSKPLD